MCNPAIPSHSSLQNPLHPVCVAARLCLPCQSRGSAPVLVLSEFLHFIPHFTTVTRMLLNTSQNSRTRGIRAFCLFGFWFSFLFACFVSGGFVWLGFYRFVFVKGEGAPNLFLCRKKKRRVIERGPGLPTCHLQCRGEALLFAAYRLVQSTQHPC